jgi:hypothetical protein
MVLVSDSSYPEAKEAKLEDVDSSEPQLQVPTFEFFRQKFSRELSSDNFGEHKHAVPKHSKSAGAKVLEKTGVKNVLLKTSFLRRVHHLLKKCARLMKEQAKVRAESANLGRAVKKYRDAQNKLQSLQEDIAELTNRLEKSNMLSLPMLEHLNAAVKGLQATEDALCNTEQAIISRIHPDIRRKHDKSAKKKYEFRWKSLLPPYDYDLASLNKKAPEYWLIDTLDSELQRCLIRSHKDISKATRYGIISAILKSSGLEPISPSRIKEYFADIARKKRAANSQVT